MISRLRLPPDPFDLRCNLEMWPTEKPIVRIHDSAYGATEFNPGKSGGRFHPLRHGGRAVPTLYGSNTFDGALSETVFHNVPMRQPGKTIQQPTLLPMVSSTLLPRRPLQLVQLKGFGLAKLELTRAEMIESGLDQYPVTRAWAAALYAAAPDADGLIWMSRQHDMSEAIMLFGTRVQRKELAIAAPPQPLHPPHEGWNHVVAAAEAAGIVILTAD